MEKKPRKPKAPIRDGEIGTPEHDELLQWLWSNLDDVAHSLFSHDAGWLEHEYKEKLDKETSAIHVIAQECELRSKTISMNPAVRAEFANKAKELRDALSTLAIPKADKSCGLAVVTDRALQIPLYETEKRIAGYVDVSATVQVGRVLDFWMVDAVDAKDAFEERRDICTDALVSDEDRDRIENIRRISIGDPQLIVVNDHFDIWFDVRTHIGAIGELLRDLKAMRALDRGKNIEVCLVCENINPVFVDMLIHEGFWVFERQKNASRKPHLKVVK